MTRRRRLAAGIAAALTITAAAASAATPDKGTVGSSSPKVEWAGELRSSGTYYTAWESDPTAECPGTPVCDPYVLTVAEEHNVTLRLNIDTQNATGGDPGAGIRVKFPDGSYQYTQGNAGPTSAMVVKLKNLKAGDYEINTVASHVCCGTDPYRESAEVPELVGGAPAPAPGPAPAPTVTPAPGGGGQPASAQLTVKAGKASARKLTRKHKYAVKVTTSAPLTAVSGRLLKGKKTVGKAKLAKLSGTRKLTLKLSKKRKVRKGRYTVVVSGTDAGGHVVTSAVKVKVKR